METLVVCSSLAHLYVDGGHTGPTLGAASGFPGGRAAAEDALFGHLRSLVEEPGRAALLLDFDGTLAPIVDRPLDARPLPAAIEALVALRSRLGSVAVLSGRPVDFLTRFIPDGIDLAGLDGLQRRVGGVVVEDPRVRAFAPLVASTASEVERLLPGVVVESKSNISVSIHWRTAPDLEGPATALALSLAERHGLVIQPGRSTIELRPAIPIDKGVVSAELVRGFTHAAFIGDDATDLTAFETLADLRRRGSLVSLVLIAVENDEAPHALVRLANTTTRSPDGVATLLQQLASALTGDA